MSPLVSILILVALPIGGGAIWHIRRRRKFTWCDKCKGDRYELKGEDKLDRLEEGQRRELRVGSVEYRVYECITCRGLAVERNVLDSAPYGDCPTCEVRTAHETVTLLAKATTREYGTQRVDLACEFCGYSGATTRTLPKLPDYDDFDDDFD